MDTKSKRVKDNKNIRVSTLRSMKLFRTIRRGYVYQPYLREDDVIVDPREHKFMPHKRNMIFIRKKGNHPLLSSANQREEEDEAIGGEDDNVESRREHQREVGPSRVSLMQYCTNLLISKQKPYQTSKLFDNSFRLISLKIHPSLILSFRCSKAYKLKFNH